MEAQEPEVTETAQSIASVFPYLMVISACFFTGFAFLSFNVPLLDGVMRRVWYASPHDAVASIPRFWKEYIHRDSGATVFLLYALSALMTGFVVQPFALAIGGTGARLYGRLRGVPCYTTALALAKFPEFAYWLQTHRAAKVAWEWEMFNYYLFAGLFTNLLTGWLSAMVTTQFSLLSRALLGAVVLFSAIHAFERSLLLRRAYDYYRGRMEDILKLVEIPMLAPSLGESTGQRKEKEPPNESRHQADEECKSKGGTPPAQPGA